MLLSLAVEVVVAPQLVAAVVQVVLEISAHKPSLQQLLTP
jgi:hypothetical protein